MSRKLDDIPVPENIEDPKAINDYLKDMLLEAKKPRELEQDQGLEKIRQKVLNIIRPLSKLWVGVDKVKCSGKSGRNSLEALSTAIEQTVVLVCQASQSVTYQNRHNVLTSLLKSTSKILENQHLF